MVISKKKKKTSSLEISLQFPTFRPKIIVISKKILGPTISSYLSIYAPNIFQQSRGTLLRNLYYSQKIGNRRWVAPEL